MFLLLWCIALTVWVVFYPTKRKTETGITLEWVWPMDKIFLVITIWVLYSKLP